MYDKIVFILVLSTAVTIETSGSIYGQCKHDTLTFNCSGIDLQEIPEETDIPSSTEILDLSSNSIRNITLLNYPALKNTLSTLNLSKNQISVLTNDAFKFLTSLVELDLSRNVIEGKSLEENMFYDLKKLKVLNMEKNPLRYIKKDTFVFMELPSLLSLDLSHCEISDMEAGSIDLPSLEFLDISWNMISTFSMDAFKMLTNLQTLDMSHNMIHVLSEVPYMPALDTWILDSNNMEKIEIKEGIENYADKLKNLYLRFTLQILMNSYFKIIKYFKFKVRLNDLFYLSISRFHTSMLNSFLYLTLLPILFK